MKKIVVARTSQTGWLPLCTGLFAASLTTATLAQTPDAAALAVSPLADTRAGTDASKASEQRIDQLTSEVEELKKLVHQLQGQQASATSAAAPAVTPAANASVPPVAGTQTPATAAPPGAPAAESPKLVADMLRGMTVNAMFDSYFEHNYNSPIGRANTLRAYDVSSNSFSLNQVDLLLESAPDPAAGKRAGMRVDLQYGQATSTLQGNPVNEFRPEVYRNVYQAYGTYVFPVGQGLTVDFGKWASSLGIEGNYTKDQLNYTRSWWFNFLPFYHSGIRAKYAVNDQATVNFWLTNGSQQTEAFNNYKDQMLGFVLTPTPALSWTLNLYRGQEHPDVTYLQNPGPGQQNLPNVQGTYIQPIVNPADGKLEIVDSYLSWQVSPKFLLAAELDYVRQRQYSYSSADTVKGGALYASYQLSPEMTLSARTEFLADRNGLFSGTKQNLKEGTLTLEYRPEDRFLIRAEYRRDYSSTPFFQGSTLGGLKASQPTIGVGLVWWFGQKEGAW